MGKLPYFPFYVSDWLSSRTILTMSYEQKGIYIQLLAHSWLSDGCDIPTDRKLLQKLCPGAKWKNIKSVIDATFINRESSVTQANPRLLVEHSRAMLKSDKARESYKHTKRFISKQSNDNRTIIERSSIQIQSHIHTHKKKNLTVPAKNAGVKEVINYFIEQVKSARGFEPAVNWGQDGKRVKEALKIIPIEAVKSCIDFFLTSKKSDDLGISLSIALSAHTLNQFRQEGETHESRAEHIARICRQSYNIPGGVQRKKVHEGTATIVDGEAHEIPEVETGEDG